MKNITCGWANYPKNRQFEESRQWHENHGAALGNCDSWTCECGNTPEASGFFPCDEQGNDTEPLDMTDTYLRCDSCGAIYLHSGETIQNAGRP